MAGWAPPNGTPVNAPILLRPLTITSTSAAEEDLTLSLTAGFEVNPLLLHMLSRDYGLTLDTDRLLDPDDDPDATVNRLAGEVAPVVTGFAVDRRLVAATFLCTKLSMVNDIQSGSALLHDHPVIAAMAGDDESCRLVRGQGHDPDLRDPDRVPPAAEFLVLDADASQNYAINAVLRGRNLVIPGPPGTGKSQTIANLIATLAAHGRKVLFVAEKRTAAGRLPAGAPRAGQATGRLAARVAETMRSAATSASTSKSTSLCGGATSAGLSTRNTKPASAPPSSVGTT
jgi:hypothetical protein